MRRVSDTGRCLQVNPDDRPTRLGRARRRMRDLDGRQSIRATDPRRALKVNTLDEVFDLCAVGSAETSHEMRFLLLLCRLRKLELDFVRPTAANAQGTGRAYDFGTNVIAVARGSAQIDVAERSRGKPEVDERGIDIAHLGQLRAHQRGGLGADALD